jgi:glycosyltransferase involved in cell wall biosynthesis
MGAPIGISVIILTRDEESTIAGCLESVAWADDVIIVDSFSGDRTIAAARSCHPAVRIFENAFQDFGQQRNWALDHTSPKHSWVLFVDADERITAACLAEMASAVNEPRGHVGYFLCGRNFFLGRWVRHCQLFPSWQLRLLKPGEVRYRKEGHGQREVTEGPLGYIREPYDHLTFSKGVAEWLGRHNRYSTNEIELIQRLRGEPINLRSLFHRDPVERRRCLKTLAARLPCRPLFRFLYGYVIRRGFLDGRAGFVLCLLRFAQDIDTMAKLAESKAIERGMPPDHGPEKR